MLKRNLHWSFSIVLSGKPPNAQDQWGRAAVQHIATRTNIASRNSHPDGRRGSGAGSIHSRKSGQALNGDSISCEQEANRLMAVSRRMNSLWHNPVQLAPNTSHLLLFRLGI